MRPDRHGAGFAMPTAIFLLVVVSLLAALMLRFVASASTAEASDLRGARAYRAAHTGLEKARYELNVNSNCPAAAQALASPAAFADLAITWRCAATGAAFSEGTATTKQLYLLIATASGGTLGQPTYIERELQASVER